MSEGAGPIRSVLVAGGGVVGASAALAFARALPGAKVSLVATPADPAALADRLPATLPATNPLLDLIAWDEDALVRAGAATHRLGARFEGWRADGAAWVHAFGDTGVPIAGSAFHQHWLDARRARARTPYHQFSPGAALALAGRFVDPAGDARSLLSRFAYALRLDPLVAVPLLLADARARGIDVSAGTVESVVRDDRGWITAIRLGDGRALSADLFIDAAGPSAVLAGDGARDDWSDDLPLDRLLLAGEARAAPSPLDDYKALGIGWRARWPLRARVLTGLAYAQTAATEARARRVMGAGGESAEAIVLRPGRRRTPWAGNVLALGDAAVAAGPLGCAGFALAQAHLALAIDLLPMRDLHPIVLAEYNRRAGARADRVRDFLALHHLRKGSLNEARGALADGLALFRRRGQWPRREEEMYDKQDWLAVLLGLDIIPAGRDPTAMSADRADVARTMAAFAAAVAALPATAPPYAAHLARMTGRR